MNEHQANLNELLKKEKVVALVAPSFPIDYSYPEIIGMLKKLGFDKVIELTFGARMVNYHYAQYVKSHPDQKYYITSPCPTCVALIKARYPELVQYLVPRISPMIAAARITKEHFPDHKLVFISPCLAKRSLELPKFKKDLDGIITFTELDELFNEKNISADDFKGQKFIFDSFVREFTKIYPISGGLAETAHIRHFCEDDEIVVADTVPELIKILDEAKAGTSKYRFFDILNCKGGCIGGGALKNKDLPTEKKARLILNYRNFAEIAPTGEEVGNVENAEGIDFDTEI
jgi:iron only hydrogenase large subunit-like protein